MSNKSTYYLMGFGCGSLAGLLFAPKSGSAMRAGIARASRGRRRLIKKQVSLASAAIAHFRIDAFRALKRALPKRGLRAVFQ